MSEPHFIYVIGHDTGPMKIGFSNNPTYRAYVLKRPRNPHYKVHFSLRVAIENVRGIEALAHSTLKAQHVEGEWFDVTPEAAAAAIKDAARRYANGERAPPREGLLTERVGLYLPAGFVREVDEWCKRQPGRAPTFSEAVRILVERAIEAEAKEPRREHSTKPKPNTD